MSEFLKLKQRLKNVGRNSTEYRMTLIEARALVTEFESLERALLERPTEIPEPAQHKITNILDGGNF
jgi:hypothetical protein